MNADEEEDDDGRADPARSAHFPAEWRCWWGVIGKMKSSLRRKKVIRAGRAGSALPGENGRAAAPGPPVKEMPTRSPEKAGTAIPGDSVGCPFARFPRRWNPTLEKRKKMSKV